MRMIFFMRGSCSGLSSFSVRNLCPDGSQKTSKISDRRFGDYRGPAPVARLDSAWSIPRRSQRSRYENGTRAEEVEVAGRKTTGAHFYGRESGPDRLKNASEVAFLPRCDVL